ncbi:MAG: site-specific integrase [Chitinophagaceae bacterium]
MLPIKPVCKKALMRQDGTSIIFIQYCHSQEKRTLLNSGIAIPPTYWNQKRLRINADLPTSYGKADILNEQLQESIRLAQDIVSYALKKKIADPLDFLKSTFHPGFDLSKLEEKAKEVEKPKINLDLYYQIDDYIESKRKQVTPKMINVYRNMKDTLKAFEKFRKKPITFESFDFNFYEEFIAYMKFEHTLRRRKQIIKGFKVSTVGKTIKQLRIFLNNRMRKKIIPPINLEDFKILDEETDAIYLTYQEITKIYQTDLSKHPQLIKYRNLFVLGCLTGLRFSDFSIIRSEDIRQGMLYKKQWKSDHWVVIPLRNQANNILMHHFKSGIPEISNAKFNKYVKEVGRLAGVDTPIKFSHKKGNKNVVIVKPKYGWITSHTCRRSFCTNEFLAGTPVELIMKISGHKSIKDFYRYIRITPEEAGQKIKEIWLQRGEIISMNTTNQANAI